MTRCIARPAGAVVLAVVAVLLGCRLFEGPSLVASLHAQARRIDVGSLKARTVLVQEPAGIREVNPAVTRQIQVRPWQQIVARTGNSPSKTRAFPRLAETPSRVSLPLVVLVQTPEGRTLELEPVLEITDGLMMRGNDNMFSGVISAGVLNRRDPTGEVALGQPVRFAINGPVDDIAPRDVAVDHTNLPFATAAIRARNPEQTVTLHVRVSIDPNFHNVIVPVVRPSLEVTAASDRILGFGLQTVALEVQSSGLPAPAGRHILVKTTRGGFQPATASIVLSAQGAGSISLRSEGIGSATVTASSPGMTPGSATAVFAFPWAFLVAVALGAVVGTGAKKVPEGTNLKKWGVGLIGGLCAGLLAAVAWTVGVNLTVVQPTALVGEAAIFVLSGVGAYAGLSLASGGAKKAVPATAASGKRRP